LTLLDGRQECKRNLNIMVTSFPDVYPPLTPSWIKFRFVRDVPNM